MKKKVSHSRIETFFRMKAKYFLNYAIDYQKKLFKADGKVDFKDNIKNYISEGFLDEDIELFLKKIAAKENIEEYFLLLYQETFKLDMKKSSHVRDIERIALDNGETSPLVILLFRCVYEIKKQFKKNKNNFRSTAKKLASAALEILDSKKHNEKKSL
jgi:hypothetical protein